MNLNYITDGQTLDGYIEEVERLHGSLTFSFRPVTPADRAAIFDKINGCKTSQDGEKYVAAGVVSRIVEWDLKDDKGNAAAVTTANALRLQATLSKKLFNVVMGIAASDPKPESESKPADLDEIDEMVAAAVAGRGTTEDDRLGN